MGSDTHKRIFHRRGGGGGGGGGRFIIFSIIFTAWVCKNVCPIFLLYIFYLFYFKFYNPRRERNEKEKSANFILYLNSCTHKLYYCTQLLNMNCTSVNTNHMNQTRMNIIFYTPPIPYFVLTSAHTFQLSWDWG